jgi:hypothetical protein
MERSDRQRRAARLRPPANAGLARSLAKVDIKYDVFAAVRALHNLLQDIAGPSALGDVMALFESKDDQASTTPTSEGFADGRRFVSSWRAS